MASASSVPPVAPVPAPDLRIGLVVQDRYRVLRKIGHGGFGAVYEAEHVVIKRRVAMKTLHAHLATDADVVARFHREALAATHIGHEHIVEVTDFGAFPDGTVYMVLELLEGRDLADLVEKEGPLPIGRCVRIVLQICDALAAAHARGIVHRDLKPENVFLIRRGKEPDFVKVLDFGISKFLDTSTVPVSGSLTSTGTAMGTPYYMAPEQAAGAKDVDARADVYSLGVILFRCLTGRYPITADNMALLLAKIVSTPPPRVRSIADGVPEKLDALVDRMLAKDRAARFASAADVARELEDFVTPRTPEAIDALARTAPSLEPPPPVPADDARARDETTPSTPADREPAIRRWASAASWADDAKNLGTLLTPGGLRAAAATFQALATAPGDALCEMLQPREAGSRPSALRASPVATMVATVVGLSVGSVAVQELGAAGSHGIARQVLMTLAPIGVSACFIAAAAQRITRPRLAFGEALALATYALGILLVPGTVLQALLAAMVVAVRALPDVVGLDRWVTILGFLLGLWLVSAPLVQAYAVWRASRRALGLALVPAIAAYAGLAVGVALAIPGTILGGAAVIATGAGRYDLEEPLTRWAVTLEPSTESLWHLRSIAVARSGTAEERALLARQAAAAVPGSAALHLQAARVGHPGDLERQEQELRTALALRPAYEDAAYWLTGLLATRGRDRELLEHCGAVLRGPFGEHARRECRRQEARARFRLRDPAALEAFDRLASDPGIAVAERALAAVHVNALRTLSEAERDRAVVVRDVRADGPGAAAGLEPLQVLVALEGQECSGLEGWRDCLAGRGSRARLEVLAARGRLTLTLPEPGSPLGIVFEEL